MNVYPHNLSAFTKKNSAKIGDGDLDQKNLVTTKGYAAERTQHFSKK